MNKCQNCQKETPNNKFCSRSCACTYNNKIYKKRIPKEVFCIKCGKPYKHKDSEYRKRCPACRQKYWNSCWKDTSTLGELYQKARDLKMHVSWKASYVRLHCRKMNSHRKKVCQNCGYSKHIEFCHKKPISKFNDQATLQEVNDPTNILILCRNCHWEFDHGLLKL